MADITLVTAADDRVITPGDLRTHSRIDDTGEDSYLEQLIDSATQAAESYTWRRFVTQTWDQSFDAFCDPLVLRYPPLSTTADPPVTSITYIDGAGDTQTLSTDVYETARVKGLDVVRRKESQVWPTTQAHADVVTVRMVVGYGDPDDVPEKIKQAVRVHAAHFFENREGQTMPDGFYSLLFPYQVRGT